MALAGLLPVELLRLILWLAILGAIFLPLERLFAQRRQPIWRRQVLVDLFYFFFNGLILSGLLAIPAALLALLVKSLLPDAFLQTVAALPLPMRLIAALVIGDLGAYWGHRWTHEIPLLWRFHAVHHSAPEIDWLVNTRAHPVDLVFTRFCGLVPLFALGLAQPTPGGDLPAILAAVIGTGWGFFIHANLRFRFGWLERLISTPAFHHWHHTNDAMRDRNYAALLPAIDRMFGTLHLPPAWPVEYGIDAAMPDSAGGQLLAPFRPTRPLEGEARLPQAVHADIDRK